MICAIAAFPVLYCALFGMACGGAIALILRWLLAPYFSVTEEPYK